MKNLLLFLTTLLLIACQSNQESIDYEGAKEKSELFLQKEIEPDDDIYVVLESYDELVASEHIQNTLMLGHKFKIQNAHTQAANAINAYIEENIDYRSPQENPSGIADMVFITYSNFHDFIFKMDDPVQISAASLLRLIRYSEPVEWEVLAQAYKLGKAELSEKERTEALAYIRAGIRQTLKDPSVFTADARAQEDIIAEAEEARIILGSLK